LAVIALLMIYHSRIRACLGGGRVFARICSPQPGRSGISSSASASTACSTYRPFHHVLGAALALLQRGGERLLMTASSSPATASSVAMTVPNCSGSTGTSTAVASRDLRVRRRSFWCP